jgi:hypothetical protein
MFGRRLKANADVHAAAGNHVIAPDATLREVAFAIGTALDREGIRAVLCGGSAATFYAPQAYQSEDLDFVLSFGTEGRAVRSVLARLGYRLDGSLFVHADSHFTVEFPPGPLAIGAEPVERVDTFRNGASIVHVISATDAVRDRLNKFAVWDDFSALRAAVAVARESVVDLDAVRAFTEREGRGVYRTRFEEAFRVFERRVREGRLSL